MNNIRGEYPRPQFVRKDWISLNGVWDFTVDNSLTGEERNFQKAEKFDMEIIVPFCPESKLSGLEIKDFMNGVWYTRTFSLPEVWLTDNRHTFLNIDACDYITKVFINGNEVGIHRGGYISFSFEISKYLHSGENRVTIYAQDDTRNETIPTGKQSTKFDSYGCLYTRTTGIWQTVWLENTPDAYIKSVKMTSSISDKEVRVDLKAVNASGFTLKTEVRLNDEIVGRDEHIINWDNLSFSIKLDKIKLWDIDTPNLYDITFMLGSDRVDSYFGIREISFKNGRTYLNGKPVFQRLILDQGYFPDGIYTAPSDEELLNDIKRAQAMGFNGARLHEKIFEPRFLYHADRCGYMVWGEYPNWGLNVAWDACYKNMVPEWLDMLNRDYNHPSIIGWCPLNETQKNIDPEFVKLLFNITKSIDPTRLFIDNSGWHHIAGTYDIFDVHDYCGDPEIFNNKYLPLSRGEEVEYLDDNDEGSRLVKKSNEITFISEFGGAWWSPQSSNDNNWGYGEKANNENEFLTRLKGLVDALLDNPKITAFCYTQLTDVEQEQNGLYTYERVAKFDPKMISKIISRKATMEE